MSWKWNSRILFYSLHTSIAFCKESLRPPKTRKNNLNNGLIREAVVPKKFHTVKQKFQRRETKVSVKGNKSFTEEKQKFLLTGTKVSLDETKVKLSFNEFRIPYVCCFLILYLWCYRAVKNWLTLQNASIMDLFMDNLYKNSVTLPMKAKMFVYLLHKYLVSWRKHYVHG